MVLCARLMGSAKSAPATRSPTTYANALAAETPSKIHPAGRPNRSSVVVANDFALAHRLGWSPGDMATIQASPADAVHAAPSAPQFFAHGSPPVPAITFDVDFGSASARGRVAVPATAIARAWYASCARSSEGSPRA